MSRRILFLNHVGILGGAEYCLIDMAVAFRENCQVLLFSDGPLRERLEAQGVIVNILPAPDSLLGIRTSSGMSSLKSIPALIQLSRQIATIAQDFDVIHTNSQKAFVIAALSKLWGSPPVLWHLRDIMTSRHFSPINRKVAISLANRFISKVLIVSQGAADQFIALGGKPSLVRVIYDGIPPDPFIKVTPEQITAVRTELGIGDAPLLGAFSRLSPWKGQHILVEALYQLPEEVHALIVGDALFGESDYVKTFKAAIADPKIAHRVHWLGFRTDVPVLMSACDIVVHTSTEPEPCARVGVEGQLAEKPVIAANAGGMPEIVEDYKTGRLYAPGDVGALATALQEMLSDTEALSLMAKQGKAHALSRFSLANCIGDIESVIEEVVTA
ncbi:MAG: Glycosyltransferase involved in cell wall bisynthesis [Chloroflexi bacterium AL-N5]|nr:Glycosyltransferase involved in cell wall bisynthesis [Chloroflexi bacterium AL-N5]